MSLSNTDLRNGTVYRDGSQTFLVLKFELIKKGRGSSNVKVRVRDLSTGATVEKSYGGNESVQEVQLTRSDAQYLYTDASNVYFMDSDTYEQFSFDKDLMKDVLNFVKEGEKVIVLKLDGKPATVEIPKSVVLSVSYTEPGVKGDTSTNAMKEATLETGYKIKVPLFIKIGEKIKINTETGNYSSKA